ncbi:aminopeptidase [Oceanispirochaeta crateris]|uniref:Aminopeptidase n=1 Tax=Oceanispirochaeta crateris TaxID=2518645 RepID=A0A5C1QIE5_9SPIO|nr:aminopeptidase [Oceanispirochaeta crateris]QEN07351.1 aminopeptidase [Oceanispirochaeta crateris]
MKDPRLEELAHSLVHYATELQKGEKVLIHMNGSLAEPLVKVLIEKVYEAGAIPFFSQTNERILRGLLKNISEEQLEIMAEADRLRMSRMDAYIGIGSVDNPSETSDIPQKLMKMYMEKYVTPVHMKERIKNTRWVVLRYPTASMAQAAGMSQEGFEDFYFQVCNLDYKKMSRAMDKLVELMEQTDRVRITGPGTDLRFSIKGMKAIKCDGKINIPDGEVFTAPLRESVQGTLSYNCPAEYMGFSYENISFTFKDGKIIEAKSNDNVRINEVLDTDDGARYIGEFALGVNPYILLPMKNTLFDEKIMGSFHFTPGNAYDTADNGNKSSIHWDLVCIQTSEFGGGQIYFDDILIRDEGIFVVDELKDLNPEQLK